MILRSRIVVPVARQPIENGAVLVSGNRIERVGRWKDFASGATAGYTMDLGDVALLPGLVNAHCHLDYTDMAGTIPPQKSFTDWIQLMLATKAGWNYSEFAASWLRGAHMLVRSGVTTVADFETVPELLPDVWSATPLRVMSLLELTGVRSRRDPRAILREALERIATLPAGRCCAGLAPHAPYSTTPELLRLCAETCRERQWPLAIHVAESKQEYDMFTRARGELFRWLGRNGRDDRDCGLGSPVRHLERHGVLAARPLAVHVNYLAKPDAALLGRRQAHVVHCPRSHAYFRHEPFPFERLVKHRVNICLGTDSLVTVYKAGKKSTVELDLFEEMRAFAAAHASVAPETIVKMATRNGAHALGLAGQAGEISPGAFADLIAIPFAGRRKEVCEAVVAHQGGVRASLIDGQWAVAPV